MVDDGNALIPRDREKNQHFYQFRETSNANEPTKYSKMVVFAGSKEVTSSLPTPTMESPSDLHEEPLFILQRLAFVRFLCFICSRVGRDFAHL